MTGRMNELDPQRNDPGARLRRLRLKRGLTLTVLAERSGLGNAFLSMVENGQRRLQRVSDIVALADTLDTSPSYLAFGISDSPSQRGPDPVALQFPARRDRVTVIRHARLADEFSALVARGDGRTAGEWLRRLAREPDVNPWVLIDQLAARAIAAGLASGRHRPALPAPQREPASSTRIGMSRLGDFS